MAQNRNRGARGRFDAARAATFFAPALFLATAIAFSGPVDAQTQPTADQLQQLQRGATTPAVPVAQPPQPDITLQPAAGPAQPLSVNPLETLMSRRAGDVQLRQFGYNVMGVGRAVTVPQGGAVQDDYVLGPGDEIVVSFRGQENSEARGYVDRNGNVTFPRLNPISASGRTFGSFRDDLQAAVHRAFVATEAFVSIGRVRQISVMVTGEVNQPGERVATGLSSVIDALLISGGVRKSGSLRNIHIVRAGRSFNVDLYSYLSGEGRATNLRLADGDRIVVPQLGKTVAITGVRRPGIYELPSGASAISVTELMRLGQGELVRGAYRESLLQIAPDGRQQYVDVTSQPSHLVRDGEILTVQATMDQAVGRVTLDGAVRIPGDFSLDRAPTLQDLLPSTDVFTSTPEPYMLFGVIQRINTQQLRREVIPFSPLWVLQKKQNVKLQSNDKVMILTLEGMRALADPRLANETATDNGRRNAAPNRNSQGGPDGQVDADSAGNNGGNSVRLPGGGDSNQAMSQAQAILNGQTTAPGSINANGGNFNNRGGQGSQVGNEVSGTGAVIARDGTAAGNQGGAGSNTATSGAGVGGQPSGLSMSEVSFIGKEYKIDLSGAVHDSGAFLVMPGTTLAQIVDAAHGLDSDVDLTHIEVTATNIDNSTGYSSTDRKVLSLPQGNLDSVIVKPLDQILFRHVFSDLTDGTVTLRGEVRYPGTYKLVRGEHMSSLLARAGGLTSVAYPYGTVFLRTSAAKAEKAGYERAAADMNEQLLTANTRQGADKITTDSLASLKTFVDEIRNQPALGRVSIVADPSVLAARPQLDPLMETGDSITIPARPTTVTVLGQVMQQGSYPYDKNLTGPDYVARAGGTARFADDGNTFVVLPDGSARRMSDSSWLSFKDETLPPGSTIVVPRDVTPFNLRQTLIDVTQIFSQLAVSVASLAVLSKN